MGALVVIRAMERQRAVLRRWGERLLIRFEDMCLGLCNHDVLKHDLKHQTHVINGTYGIVTINDDTVLFANGSRLQFSSRWLIVWLRCCRHIFDVMNALFQHLK